MQTLRVRTFASCTCTSTTDTCFCLSCTRLTSVSIRNQRHEYYDNARSLGVQSYSCGSCSIMAEDRTRYTDMTAHQANPVPLQIRPRFDVPPPESARRISIRSLATPRAPITSGSSVFAIRKSLFDTKKPDLKLPRYCGSDGRPCISGRGIVGKYRKCQTCVGYGCRETSYIERSPRARHRHRHRQSQDGQATAPEGQNVSEPTRQLNLAPRLT